MTVARKDNKPKITDKVPYEEVEWIDAESDCAWENIDDINRWAEKDYIVYERGWIISENRKYLVISAQIAGDGAIGNRTKIPKKWIVSRTPLNVTKARRCVKK